jgi:hypothetical protein
MVTRNNLQISNSWSKRSSPNEESTSHKQKPILPNSQS